MSSLIINQVKTNMSLIYFQLNSLLYTLFMCPTVSKLYNNNYVRYPYLLTTFLQATLVPYSSHMTILLTTSLQALELLLELHNRICKYMHGHIH